MSLKYALDNFRARGINFHYMGINPVLGGWKWNCPTVGNKVGKRKPTHSEL